MLENRVTISLSSRFSGWWGGVSAWTTPYSCQGRPPLVAGLIEVEGRAPGREGPDLASRTVRGHPGLDRHGGFRAGPRRLAAESFDVDFLDVEVLARARRVARARNRVQRHRRRRENRAHRSRSRANPASDAGPPGPPGPGCLGGWPAAGAAAAAAATSPAGTAWAGGRILRRRGAGSVIRRYRCAALGRVRAGQVGVNAAGSAPGHQHVEIHESSSCSSRRGWGWWSPERTGGPDIQVPERSVARALGARALGARALGARSARCRSARWEAVSWRTTRPRSPRLGPVGMRIATAFGRASRATWGRLGVGTALPKGLTGALRAPRPRGRSSAARTRSAFASRSPAGPVPAGPTPGCPTPGWPGPGSPGPWLASVAGCRRRPRSRACQAQQPPG